VSTVVGTPRVRVGDARDRDTGGSRPVRLEYLDEIRVVVVAGVIVVHSAITYGATGSWYLASLDESTTRAGEIALSLLVITGALFGMGLLFLIAGALTVPAVERKGPGAFLLARLRRLGIPLVAFLVLAVPTLEYAKYRTEGGTDDLIGFLGGHTGWIFAPGPMWFVEALLVFSAAYVALITLRRPRPTAPRPLTFRDVAAAMLSIAASSFLVRLAFPLQSEQFHLQLALFPQYAILFGFGAAAWRRGWLGSLSPGLVRRCGRLAVAGALILPAVIAAGGGTDEGSPVLGGWHWAALASVLPEAMLAVGASLWVIGRFSRHAGRERAWARRLGPASYGAFIVHPVFVVGLALAVHPVSAPAELKFLVVAPAAVAASYALPLWLGRVLRWPRAG
jgi:glucans biosynthesis protein C